MKDFAPEFKTPEQYIIDITYRIWEERGVGRIHEWYAADGPVRTPHGVTYTADEVVAATLATMHEFPDRQPLAEEVIIGEKSNGFLSSHRVRSPATHLGHGSFDKATNRPVTMLAIADCLCQANQVVDEWLVRDTGGVAHQLGIDPETHGRALGSANPDAYAIGNEAMRERWTGPHDSALDDSSTEAKLILDLYGSIWNDKNLDRIEVAYDRAARFEGPSGQLCYGHMRASSFYSGVLASIPDGYFEPHHIIVRREESSPIRVALRWSYTGSHSGYGRYGAMTNCPLALLGISHFELRNGRIINEWMTVDETALYAQIAAHQSGSLTF